MGFGMRKDHLNLTTREDRASHNLCFLTYLIQRYHGFKESDLDRTLNLLGTSTGGNTGYLDILGSTRPNITLRQVLAHLKRTYCSTLGVEYMHIPSQEKCNWIRDQVENPKWMQFSKVM